jgi:hypothetical protein
MQVIQVSVTVDGYNRYAAEQVVEDLKKAPGVLMAEYIHHLPELPNRFTFDLHYGEVGLTSDLEASMVMFAQTVSEHRP